MNHLTHLYHQFSTVNFLSIPKSSTITQKTLYHYLNFCQIVPSTCCLSGKNSLASRTLHLVSIGGLTAAAFYSRKLSVAAITVIAATKIITNHCYFSISSPIPPPPSLELLANIIKSAINVPPPDVITELILSYLPIQGALLETLEEHTSCVRFAVEIADGKFVTACEAGKVVLWDIKKPKKPIVLFKESIYIKHVISPSDNTVAIVYSDNTIKVWNLGRTIKTWRLQDKELNNFITLEGHTHTHNITCIRQLPDRIVTGSSNGTVMLWDTNRPKKPIVLHQSTSNIKDIMVLCNEIVIASYNGTVRVYNLTSHKTTLLWSNLRSDPTLIMRLSDGQIAVGFYKGPIRIFNRDRVNNKTITLDEHTSNITCIRQLPDGKIVTGCVEGKVVLWDIKKPKNPTVLLKGQKDKDPVSDITISYDTILATFRSGKIRIWWNLDNPPIILQGHTKAIRCTMLLRNRRQVVTGSDDRKVKVWG